jgi:hypothetical protein
MNSKLAQSVVDKTYAIEKDRDMSARADMPGG